MTNSLEPAADRRLVDKINGAIQHALDQGRKDFAAGLKLIHDSIVDDELERGYGDRAEDQLKTWLDRRYKGPRKRA